MATLEARLSISEMGPGGRGPAPDATNGVPRVLQAPPAREKTQAATGPAAEGPARTAVFPSADSATLAPPPVVPSSASRAVRAQEPPLRLKTQARVALSDTSAVLPSAESAKSAPKVELSTPVASLGASAACCRHATPERANACAGAAEGSRRSPTSRSAGGVTI